MPLLPSMPVVVSQYLRPIAVVLALLVVGRTERAWAQGQPLRAMHHTAWTAKDGAPQAITELAQHPDGTLWIGSESGLFIFDGLTFRQFVSSPGEPALSGEVYSLLATETGTLWATFYRVGVVRIAAGRVTVFSHVNAEPLVSVRNLREAPDGSIWAFDGPRLIRFGTDGAWRREPTPLSTSIAGIYVDSSNTLWLAQGGCLYKRSLAQAAYTQTAVAADVVTGFEEAENGDIWLNDYDAAVSVGRTQRISPAGELRQRVAQNLFTGGPVAVAADGSLILASFAAGVHRYPSSEAFPPPDHRPTQQPDTFTREHGLSSNATGALLVDADGNIWIGGARGLDRLKPARFTRYLPAMDRGNWAVCASRQGDVWVANTLGELHAASGDGPVSWSGIGDPLFSLACADGGRAWVVNSRGVWAVTAGRVTALPAIPGAPRRRQMRVVAAADHSLYATVAGPYEDGSGIWRYIRGEWSKLPRDGELSAGGYATYVDGRDRLWVGHANGRAIRHTPDGAQVFASGQPGVGYVYAFLDTSRGLFAAGTNGLAVLRDSQFEMLTFAEPSSARGIRGIVEAHDGALWLNGAGGFTHVPVKELEAGLSQLAYPMKARQIREGDYAGASQRVLGYLDSAARDSAGRLWFATANGVVHFDPNRGAAGSHPPIVAVRSMVGDGRPVNGSGVVAPATRTLEIQYFGVNLTTPENVIYRYRLQGFDESWHEAGRRTEAIYTRLPPGTYTFSVAASNGDGVWTAPVSSPFRVLPSFYQTWWFAATMVAAAAVIAGLVHRARIRQISRVMSARFDERLAERTRVARELHDTLLQTIHGSKLVADRALRDTSDRNPQVRALEQLSVWLGQAATEGRAALHSLRASTTEVNNLAGAFRRAIDECRHHSGAEMALVVHGDARPLHPVARDEVYRIGYEAIRNACVHSRASRIDVTLQYGHNLTLRISDNGSGIDASVIDGGKEGHFGLRGMRERAERIGATLTLVSDRETGTIITLTVTGEIVFRPA